MKTSNTNIVLDNSLSISSITLSFIRRPIILKLQNTMGCLKSKPAAPQEESQHEEEAPPSQHEEDGNENRVRMVDYILITSELS